VSDSTPIRALIVAEACNPEWVSVPLVGWSHYAALAARPDVEAHLVTQVRNRDALVRAGLTEGENFTALDTEKVAGPLFKLGDKLAGGKGKGWTTRMAVSALGWPYFERLLWRQFGGELKAGEFDVVHQLTPLSPTLAPRTAGRCRKINVPFVWGPLNGGVPWPKEFDSARRREKEWLSYVRDVYKLSPGYRPARRDASAILIASMATWRQMNRVGRQKAFYLPENAIDPTRFNKRRTRTATLPLRCVFLGRLVPYKGCDMLIEAAAPLVREGKLTIDVIGDGPQRGELEAMISGEKLESGVTLSGWVEHAAVQDRLIESDVLTFPSIREFGGGVVLEANAVGLPCVVPDYGGVGELVNHRTGWRLPMGTRGQLVSHLRGVLRELVENPAAVDNKGAAAYADILAHHTWAARAAATTQIYRWLKGQADRPPRRLRAA
jgi:glycosyltransferase involved in cell wall biosynthesis